MRARLALAIAATSCLALTTTSHAAAAKPQLTDPKGDSPVAGADIVSAKFTSTFKRVRRVKTPTGFTLTLTLAAAPAKQVWYQIQVAKADCPTFEFEYSTSSLGGGPAGARCADGVNTKYETKVAPAKVSGTTVTWKVPSKILPVGTTFS